MTDNEITDLWDDLRRQVREEDPSKSFGGDFGKFIIKFARAYELRAMGEVLKRLQPLADESDGLLQQVVNVIENLVDCVELEGYPFEPADVADGNNIKAKIIDHLEKFGCWSRSSTPLDVSTAPGDERQSS